KSDITNSTPTNSNGQSPTSNPVTPQTQGIYSDNSSPQQGYAPQAGGYMGQPQGYNGQPIKPQGYGAMPGMQSQSQGYGATPGISNQPQGYGAMSGMQNQPQGYGAMSGMQNQPQGYGAMSGMQNQPQGYGAVPGMQNQPQGYGAMPGQMQLTPAPRPAQNKKPKWPLILGISLAIIAIIITVVIIIHKNKEDYKNKDSKKTTSTRTTEDIDTTEIPETTATTTEVPIYNEGTKTIMIYIVGADLETENGLASEEIYEIIDSDFDQDKMNVLIYTGGSRSWYHSDVPDNNNAIFLVEDNGITLLEEYGQDNMGDPDTLTGFLNYGYENYPAEQYAVVFWNHGGGAFWGYGMDENSGDHLTLVELSGAFANSPFNGSNKLEFIGFDACLMANLETATILSPYANYMIASQEIEPGYGWDYEFLDSIDDMTSGADMGAAIVDSYIETTNSIMQDYPYWYCNLTLAVMDLSQVENVNTAMDNLYAKANQDLCADTYSQFSRIRSNSKTIADEYTDETSYDIVDLKHLARNMSTLYPSEANALEAAVDQLVVYSQATEDNCNGVSVYHPYDAKMYSAEYIPQYKDFGCSSEYEKYITNFATLLNSQDTTTVDWDPYSLNPYTNGDLSFSVQLSEEQLGDLQNAYFVISREDPDRAGNYVFVSMSNDVTIDTSNIATANFDGQIIYMQNDTTYEQYEVMYTIQETTDTYTRYLLTSILYNDDIQGEDAMYAYFVMDISDAHPEGELLGAYPISNFVSSDGTDIFPDRYQINLNDYSNIAFGAITHQFTGEEDLTNFNEADWQDAVLMYNYFPISEGFSTVLGTMDPSMSYYGMFIFEDTQGNRHCSNLVQLQ
ncbi:MAG: hypothetical protein E7258_09260, partial [Lachnospiraceae bacterium]|nr:hypothetical protein [Lachnospiraceae bacterium]